MNDTPLLAAMFAKPESGFDTYAPEHVSPLVAWLGSRDAVLGACIYCHSAPMATAP